MFTGARIAGVHFEAVPRDFDEFLMISPDGYSRSSAVRREDVQRPAAHGSFALPAVRDAQVFTFKGVAKRKTAWEMEALEEQVRGICGAGGWDHLTVDEGAGSRTTEVGLASVDFDVLGSDPTIAEFQIQFWAPSPRMFGKVTDFAAGTPAVSRGSFPATPRLLIGAGTGGYTITGPNGRQIVVGASAPAGAHYIDFAQGGLFTAAGVRVPGAMSVFQPWTVGPGLPGVVASITGARSLVQRVTDTYI